MEYIQREGCYEGIAKCVLLVQVTRNGAWLLVPPCAPLVDKQTNLTLGILLVHNGLVLLDHLFYLKALAQSPVVLIGIELSGRALRTIPTCAGVVVERDTLHTVANLIHTYFGPVVIIIAGTRGDAIEAVLSLVAQIGVELTELVAVILWSHVTTAAPSLVADAEVFYLPSLVAAILAAQTGHWRVAVAGHILNPLGHLLNGTRTYVTTDVRLAAQHLAEIQELVGAERVVLDSTTPVIVAQRWTL